MNSKTSMKCEWLPLALFDSHSQFVLMFGDLCFDVGIDGDALHVVQSTNGEYRSVSFGSDMEFECFLKLQFSQTLVSS